MLSPASTTAPTRGLGATRPQPRRARSRARSIAARSGGRSESEPDADTSEDMSRLGIEVLELRDVLLVLPRLQANLAYKLHGREGEATVDEYQGARVGRVDHHGSHARRGDGVIEPDVRVARFVTVDPDSRREINDREFPPCDRAVAVARQIHGELELVARADYGPEGPVAEPRYLAVHPAHGDRGNGKGSVEHTHSEAVPDAQRRVEELGRMCVYGEI